MFLIRVMLFAGCLLLPAIAQAENSTTQVENTRDTKILSLQNDLYTLQKINADVVKNFLAVNASIQNLQKTTTVHDKDIVRLLDAINTTNSNTLETGDNLSSEIALIKKMLAEHVQNIQKLKTSFDTKYTQLASATTAQIKKSAQQLQKKINVSTAGISQEKATIEKQVATISALEKKLAALEKTLDSAQREINEFKTTITSQRQNTLSHISSLENINATLSGLQERSQNELKNIHQSLGQVITYGLVTMLGVILLTLLILFVTRRKNSISQTKTTRLLSKNSQPVHEKDDEILDWLKQKKTNR